VTLAQHRIAFTGPQFLHIFEERLVLATLDTIGPPNSVKIITGGCVGLDAFVASTMHARGYHVHTVLPAKLTKVDRNWAVYCTTHETCPPGRTDSETYRLRNTRMVGQSDQLIAFIRNGNLAARSGEVMTYNIAHKAGKPINLVSL
jgi:hypothetical protein